MDKLKMHTPNLTQDNIVRIRELFPNCVTEAKDDKGQIKLAIDFDQLKQELSDSIVEGPQERYHLNWPGKREALLTANAPIAKTLRPCREESVDFDTTKNLFIEGDNLDALKLLQETYLGKVKMIYIDPPYNTGNDFIYEDDFAEDAEGFLVKSNQKDEQGNRLVANTEANGRFHSDWLSMMYSRLKLSINLLKDDGVILISIDGNEVHNLRKICDEVFGEDNFVDCIVWDKKASAKGVPPRNMMVNVHEYIVAYQKCDDFRFLGERRDEAKDGFKNPDNDPRGPWRESNIKSTTKPIDEAFTITDPNTGREYTNTWAFSKESLERMIADGRILWKETLPKQKEFMYEMTNENKAIKSSWGIFDPQSTTVSLKKLIPEVHFENPKPLSLMDYLLRVSLEKDSVILDFFAGSATTAHAVMQLNAEDGGNRRFIMVQLPEACDKNSEGFKAGYTTIAEFSKERIRRAGKKIKEEQGLTAQDLDIGFRVLKVDTSNMADVYYTPDAIKQDLVAGMMDNIKPDRKSEDLLFQVLLDWGVDLTLPIRKQVIQGKTVFFVSQPPYDLVACFDAGVTEALIKELAGYKPLRVVFRDSSFASDSVKINAEQIFKQLSPGTEVRSI